MKKILSVLIIFVFILLAGCGNKYEQRIERVKQQISELEMNENITLQTTDDSTFSLQEITSIETPKHIFNEEEDKEVQHIDFTGNLSINTYPNEVALLYYEFQKESSLLKSNFEKLETSEVNLLDIQILINSFKIKNDILVQQIIPEDFKENYEPFIKELKVVLAKHIELGNQYIDYLNEPNVEVLAEIKELQKELEVKLKTLNEQYHKLIEE